MWVLRKGFCLFIHVLDKFYWQILEGMFKIYRIIVTHSIYYLEDYIKNLTN